MTAHTVLSERSRTALLLLAALLIGTYWLFAFPPWQHNDEPTHFEYAWHLAHWGHAPRYGIGARDLVMQREMVASLVTHDFYRGVGDAPPFIGQDDVTPFYFGYDETVHPATYYWLVTLPLKASQHLDITSQLYAARTMSLLLFVLIIAAANRAIGVLTPPEHPLRWVVPLTMVLWPPFASHMTGVNNDVGAVFAVTLYLWGVARMVRDGPSLLTIVWLVGAGLLGLAFKTTASLALATFPVVLLVALWLHRGWRWRTLFVPLALMAVLVAALVFVPTGAKGWTRSESVNTSRPPLRVARADGKGDALQIEAALTNGQLVNAVLSSRLAEIESGVVSVGGWVWADAPLDGYSPGLQLGLRGEQFKQPVTEPLSLTTTPTLVIRSYRVPNTVQRLDFMLSGARQEDAAGMVYLDDAFIVPGTIPSGAEVRVAGDSVTINGEVHRNLLRNPSAAQGSWMVRSTVDALVQRYARRTPTRIFATFFDSDEVVPLLQRYIVPSLFAQLFGSFAWGHVTIAKAWYPLGWLLGGVALIGVAVWWLRHRRLDRLSLTLLLWLLVLLLGWVNALLWPLAYDTATLKIPSARYLHPMLLVMALMLAGGWWALWPQRRRPVGLGLFFGLLLIVNVVAAQTIRSYYAPPPYSVPSHSDDSLPSG